MFLNFGINIGKTNEIGCQLPVTSWFKNKLGIGNWRQGIN